MRRLLLGTASVGCLVCYSSIAGAVPTINGVNLLGFSSQQSVGFTIAAGNTGAGTNVGTGELYLSTDSQGNVYFALVQPIGLNNNTYGTTSTIGATLPSPYNNSTNYPEFFWSKQHNLTDLLGSDAANFVFYDSKGNAVFNFDFDYAASNASEVSTCGDLTTCSLSQNDAKLTTGTASWLTQYATSLSYDCGLDPLYCGIGTGNTTNSPTPSQSAGWVNANIYEGEISAAAFGTNGFGGVEIPLVHDSPAENQSVIQFATCLTECKLTGSPPSGVPEPSSLSELLAGLAALMSLMTLSKANRSSRVREGLRSIFPDISTANIHGRG